MINYKILTAVMFLSLFLFSISLIIHSTSEDAIARDLLHDYRLKTEQCSSGEGTYDVCRWDPQMICDVPAQTVCGGSSDPEVN